MDGLIGFFRDNSCLLFFVNGLAFFTLGLAIALERRRASTIPIIQSLWLLSAYGFVASLGNWLQMFMIARGHSTSADPGPVGHALKVVLFVLAALFLCQFGVRIIASYDPRFRWLNAGYWVVAVAYAGILVGVLTANGQTGGDWISSAEVWARYLLYFPGLALAASAFLLHRQEWHKLELHRIAHDCTGAATALGVKMAVSGLAAVPILGPSGPDVSSWTLLLQAVRTLTTAAVAVFVVRMLRASEIQRQRQLDEAVAERIEAQERALHGQEQACDEIQRWSASMADMVQTVSSAISHPSSLEETLQIVLRETIALARLQSGAVFLLDEAEPVLRLVAHEGLPPWITSHLSQVEVGDGLAGWVAQQGELLVIEDITGDHRPFVPRSTEAVRFYVGVPLMSRGKVVGVLSASSLEPQQLTRQQVVLLDAVGQQLGVAIENSRLYQRIRYLATAEERSRLAREIHDSLSQLLGYLNLRATSTEQLLAQGQIDQARRSLREVKQIAQDAYADARETIFSLRATARGAGLLQALQGYLADYHTHYGLDASLSIDDESLADFPADTAIQISCIIQEALANVRRHAGATQVWVRFEPEGSGIRISIEDNGRGFEPEGPGGDGGLHFGLSIMSERAESVGGTLAVDTQPGQGTRLVIWVPKSRGN